MGANASVRQDGLGRFATLFNVQKTAGADGIRGLKAGRKRKKGRRGKDNEGCLVQTKEKMRREPGKRREEKKRQEKGEIEGRGNRKR